MRNRSLRAFTVGVLSLLAVALFFMGGRTPAVAALPHTSGEPQWGTDIQVSPDFQITPEAQRNFSMAINPTNPDNIIASYNSQVLHNYLSGYASSTDSGRTWTGGRFTGPWKPDNMTPFGFTSVAYDAQGTGFYASQATGTDNSGYFVLTTTNGLAWSTPLPIA